MTAASAAQAKVPPELLPTPLIAAVAVWVVDRPPGLATSMVTCRTILLPVSTSVLAAISITVPARVSKVESRVTSALCPT